MRKKMSNFNILFYNEARKLSEQNNDHLTVCPCCRRYAGGVL